MRTAKYIVNELSSCPRLNSIASGYNAREREYDRQILVSSKQQNNIDAERSSLYMESSANSNPEISSTTSSKHFPASTGSISVSDTSAASQMANWLSTMSCFM
jgi:hypothetical protein